MFEDESFTKVRKFKPWRAITSCCDGAASGSELMCWSTRGGRRVAERLETPFYYRLPGENSVSTTVMHSVKWTLGVHSSKCPQLYDSGGTPCTISGCLTQVRRAIHARRLSREWRCEKDAFRLRLGRLYARSEILGHAKRVFPVRHRILTVVYFCCHQPLLCFAIQKRRLQHRARRRWFDTICTL